MIGYTPFLRQVRLEGVFFEDSHGMPAPRGVRLAQVPGMELYDPKKWSIIYGRVLDGTGKPLSGVKVTAVTPSMAARVTSWPANAIFPPAETLSSKDGIYVLPIAAPSGTNAEVSFDGRDTAYDTSRGDFPGPEGVKTISRTRSFPIGKVVVGAVGLGVLGLAGYGLYSIFSK